jgi:hypothetical protein
MALVATAKNLAVSQNRATKNSSKARLWVNDRRLELLTRAFTLFGGTCAGRIASQARVPILDRGAAMPGVRSIRRGSDTGRYMHHRDTAKRRAPNARWGAFSGALERTVALIASAVPGSAERDAGPIEGAGPRPWWINVPPPAGASRAEQWISGHALMNPFSRR